MHIGKNDYQVIFILFLDRLKDDVRNIAQNFGLCEVSGFNKIVIDFNDCKIKIRITDSNRLIMETENEEVQEHYLALAEEVEFFMNCFSCWCYAGLEKALKKIA